MEFKRFENKKDYLEYIQIFVYHELIIQRKSNISIEDYIKFELTDILIDSFNKWVLNSDVANSIVFKWFSENKPQTQYFRENFPTIFVPKVSIWSDRNKTTYYREKLQDSFLFENYIAELISNKYGIEIGQYFTPEGQYELGENALGIEIKNDTLIEKYGNVYIEYQEKSRSGNQFYVNSGILKSDNCEYFLIGTIEKFYIFRKSKLIQILAEELDNIKRGYSSQRYIKFKEISTSRGYVYPVRYAINDTISMDLMINEIRSKFGL